MQYKDLTDEQKAKASACKTAEEMLAFAKAEGIELSDDDLQKITGGFFGWGSWGNSGSCPECGSDNYWISEDGREAWCECGYRGPASSFFNHK